MLLVGGWLRWPGNLKLKLAEGVAAWKTAGSVALHQEQDGTVIPPDTGFSFRRLLWLAGLSGGILTQLQAGTFTFTFVYLMTLQVTQYT
jgi:hypothetical protein